MLLDDWRMFFENTKEELTAVTASTDTTFSDIWFAGRIAVRLETFRSEIEEQSADDDTQKPSDQG